MNSDKTDTRIKANGETTSRRFPYTSPKIVIYGDVTDLTKSTGPNPPHDSETQSTKVSP